METDNAWVAYVNSHGGIAGRNVKLIQMNDSCDPGQSLAAAKQLIADHVLAIFDNTSADRAWASAVTKAGIPVICGTSSSNNETCFTIPDFFPTGTTVLTNTYANVDAAKLAGAKSYGLVYCTEVVACAEVIPITEHDVKSQGLTWVPALGASLSAPSYTAQCVVMSDAHAESVFPAGPPADKFAADCAKQGYRPIITQASGTWQFRFATEPALANSTGPYPDIPWFINNSSTAAFHSAVDSILQHASSPYNVSGAWAAGLLFQSAAAKIQGPPTTQAMYSSLYSLSGTTLGGFAPPLTFTKDKPGSVNCYFIVAIKNHQFVAPEGAGPTCEPAGTT
jgi:branched-chain amino acid transport system substrate-binding protein